MILCRLAMVRRMPLVVVVFDAFDLAFISSSRIKPAVASKQDRLFVLEYYDRRKHN